ncbi:outer membrane protein OmpA-like peptidoglycan-associated protein [Paraburkholderia sp. BL25I1N1]|nr:outer membrane protein OmpA-like peptidoglycan-associated protein [Paraburkholderia sp. BL25I1N1]
MTGSRLTGYPNGYPYRTLVLWISILALIWLTLSSPWSAGWNACGAMIVVGLALVATVVATRRVRARREATHHLLSAVDAALSSLPADLKRNTPLVLVIGDTSGTLGYVFGEDLVRITDAAIWVRGDDPVRLAHLADALKRWREGQGPDALAYLLAADHATGAVTLQAGLRRWRSAIGEASRAIGYPLPVCVAIYARAMDRTADESPWFGVSGAQPLQFDNLPALIARRLAQYIRVASPGIQHERQSRAYRAARLDAVTRWASETVLPALADTQRGMPPLQTVAFGVTAIDGLPAADSLSGEFVAKLTALPLSPAQGAVISQARQKQTYCPLPEALIRGIPLQPVRRALPRALAHAFGWLAVYFCAAAAASAWQNRALVERVMSDMSRYKTIAPARDAARVDALNAVKRDRDELERYASVGVPPRLGLGFYRGASLLPSVGELIAGYQPPAPAPAMIELDSMSLFRSGSAVLNPGSNGVLVSSLDLIKAHANKRVLIAGHTDSVGNPASNLKLSEARAASVRDWLADASGIALTHFAIQGYGDTRPKALNDTEAGRAANRRVEITLVPECRDTERVSPDSKSRNNGSSTTQGQTACSIE